MTEPAFPPRPGRGGPPPAPPPPPPAPPGLWVGAPPRPLAVRPLLLAVLALMLGPGPSSAAGTDWWSPTARPAPDSQIDVTGEPFKGTDPAGKVRGFVDAHDHLFANEGFGGRLICGKPFSEAGVADALKDCPEHYPDGSLAIFDYITKGGDGKHDPVGWPTFKDWPAYD